MVTSASLCKSAWRTACFVLLAGSAAAAPSIQQVTGTLNHKSTITISGSSFGTKSTVAPLIWDDGSGVSDGAFPTAKGWSGGYPSGLSGSNAYANLQYRSVGYRSMQGPHSNTTRYLTGAGIGWFSGAPNVMAWKTFNFTAGQKVYVSFYQRFDPNWRFGDENNTKNTDWAPASEPYTGAYWYTEYNPRPFNVNGPMHWKNLVWTDDPAVSPFLQWVKVEMEFLMSTSGTEKIWDNGVLKMDTTGATDPGGSGIRTFSIGGFQRPDMEWGGEPYVNNFRYFTDMYIDTSWSRVILGNGSTLNASTIREIQIPSAWSASSITFTANHGKFTPGQTAYLYVVDSDSVANTNGFPVTVGGAGGGQLSPPTNLRIIN